MKRNVAILSCVGFIATTGAAHAYIDPGTGSVITTAILGFFAAIAYTARKYFYRIKDLFTGNSKKAEHARPQNDS